MPSQEFSENSISRIEEAHEEIKSLKEQVATLEELLEVYQQTAIAQNEQLEQALKELRNHVNNSPLATIEWDREGRVRRWSKQAEKIFGWNEGEVLGKHLNEWKFVYPSHRKDVDEVTERLISKIESKNISCNRNYTKDGRIIDCEWYNSVLLDKSGEIISVLSLAHDITERQQAEVKLRESKRLIEQVTESSSAILYIVDLREIQNVYVNSQMERLLGYSAQEIQAMGRNMLSILVHPEDFPMVLENNTRCFSLLDDQWIETEYRMRDKQGNWHWLYSRDRILSRTADGKPKQLLGTAIDITERKLAEAALRESEFRFQQLAAASPGVIYTVVEYPDQPARYEYLSPAFEVIHEIPISEALENPLITFNQIHPDDRAGYQQAGEIALAGMQQFKHEWRIVTHQGKIKWIQANSQPQRRENGEIVWHGIVLDVSERKLAEAALIESQTRLAEAQRLACLGSWEFDVVNQKITWSKELFHIFGLDSSQPAPDVAEYLQKIHPDDRADLQQQIDSAIAIGKPYSVEHRIITADGNCRYIFGRGEAVLNRQGQVIKLLGTAMDITERKQAELEIQTAKEAAVAANYAKSTFLSHMSHELRTPLNIILGFTQLMGKSDTLNPEHLENINIINRSGEHLLTLINDVLDMAKIESGSITLNERNFNLHDWLDELETMFRIKANDKGLDLIVNLSGNVPEYVRTDDIKLRQVLINLVNNAIKFTQQGSISIQVCSAEDRDRHKNPDRSRLNFAIADTGAGIPADELEKIFAPFQQTRTGKAAKEGTGLGLTISNKFVNMMGGKITASSEEGRGSIFRFDLQVGILKQQQNNTSKKLTLPAIKIAPNQPKYRVLIADDDLVNRLVLTRIISQMGLEIAEASDGTEVLEIWSQWQPHLIFMDIQMPVMDGIEATKQIKAKEQKIWQLELKDPSQISPHKTIIVALTASTFEQEKNAIMSAGCDEFIAKPFQVQNVLDSLSNHLQLTYIYEKTPTVTPPEITQSRNLKTPDFKDLPLDLINRLEQATIIASWQEISDIVNQINKINLPLGGILNSLVDNFNYQEILTKIGEYKSSINQNHKNE